MMKGSIICFLWLAVLFLCGFNFEQLPVTSQFGWRNDPLTGELKFHSGVDLGYEYGAGIQALFDGIVIRAGDYDDGYGNQVLLFHSASNSYTRYGHCADIFVQFGDYVYAGNIIASIGSTGRSTGPHLHLEYIVSSDDGYKYINPLILWEQERE